MLSRPRIIRGNNGSIPNGKCRQLYIHLWEPAADPPLPIASFSRLTEFFLVFLRFPIFAFVVVFAAVPDFATVLVVALSFAFARPEARFEGRLSLALTPILASTLTVTRDFAMPPTRLTTEPSKIIVFTKLSGATIISWMCDRTTGTESRLLVELLGAGPVVDERGGVSTVRPGGQGQAPVLR
jgi:hypothetical protein